MSGYYVQLPGGAQIGPVSTAALVEAVTTGHLGEGALVLAVGSDRWVPLHEVPALAFVLPPPPEHSPWAASEEPSPSPSPDARADHPARHGDE